MRLVNIKQLAKALNVSASGVGHMMRDGDFPVHHRGKGSTADPHVFDLDAVLKYRKARVAKKKAKKVEVDQTRERIHSANASMAEIKLAQLKAELVALDDAKRIVDEEMAPVLAALLALPEKLSDPAARDDFRELLREAIAGFRVDFDAALPGGF
jgi:hypothetical protein